VTDSAYEHHDYDVLIIGAGGAGLRAAIEAKQRGLKVGIITKSLLGKAHTVMAEGGMAAAMGNVYDEDNWMVHFRDTMRGGKYLNNNRMAELHAKESPDRVWELEQWGATSAATATPVSHTWATAPDWNSSERSSRRSSRWTPTSSWSARS